MLEEVFLSIEMSEKPMHDGSSVMLVPAENDCCA
jgi:hypothetical protein